MNLLLLALLAGPAIAQDEEEEDEFGFLDEGDEAAAKTAAEAIHADDFTIDEEDDFGDWEEAPAIERDPGPAPEMGRRNTSIGTNKATALPYSVVGKSPLADNYEAQVVFADRDAVVVELPVLVARNPSDFEGRAYWLVGEVYADGMKIAESRQQVTSNAIAQAGPTIAFVKMLVPVPAETGELELRVGRTTSAAGTPDTLFSRQLAYKL